MPHVRWARHLEHYNIEQERNSDLVPFLRRERRWEAVERTGRMILLATLGILSLSILARLGSIYRSSLIMPPIPGRQIHINASQSLEFFWNNYEAAFATPPEEEVFDALVSFDIPIAESQTLLRVTIDDDLDKLLTERLQARDQVTKMWYLHTKQRTSALQELVEKGQLFREYMAMRLLEDPNDRYTKDRFRAFQSEEHEQYMTQNPGLTSNMTSAPQALGLQDILSSLFASHNRLLLSMIAMNRALENFETQETEVLSRIWDGANLETPNNTHLATARGRFQSLVLHLGVAGDILSCGLGNRQRPITDYDKAIVGKGIFVESVADMLRIWDDRVQRMKEAFLDGQSGRRHDQGFRRARELKRWKLNRCTGPGHSSLMVQRVRCLLKFPSWSGDVGAKETMSLLGKVANSPQQNLGNQSCNDVWSVCCRILLKYH